MEQARRYSPIWHSQWALLTSFNQWAGSFKVPSDQPPRAWPLWLPFLRCPQRYANTPHMPLPISCMFPTSKSECQKGRLRWFPHMVLFDMKDVCKGSLQVVAKTSATLKEHCTVLLSACSYGCPEWNGRESWSNACENFSVNKRCNNIHLQWLAGIPRHTRQYEVLKQPWWVLMSSLLALSLPEIKSSLPTLILHCHL